MVKDVFLYNGGQRRVRLTFKPLKMFFDLLKGPDPSYPVLKFGNNLSSRNRDMAQSVILYSCDLERSRSMMRSIKFCTAMHTTHEHTCEVSLKSYCQLFRYGEQIVDRKVARTRKKERKKE